MVLSTDAAFVAPAAAALLFEIANTAPTIAIATTQATTIPAMAPPLRPDFEFLVNLFRPSEAGSVPLIISVEIIIN